MAINTNYNYYNSYNTLKNNRFPSSKSSQLGSSSNSSSVSDSLNSMLKNAQNFLSTAGLEATKLNTTLANLLGKGKKEDAIFDNASTVSSDTHLLRIKSSNGKSVSDTTVLIDQIATTQKNTGIEMNATDSAPTNGYYRFEIEIDGKKHEITFSTSGQETNKSFQQKMVDAINKTNIGVTASIAMSKDGKNSTLSLETTATGAGKEGQPLFSIHDITGDAVERTGVASITQKSQDAVYTVNGGEKVTAKSNDVDLGNGVIITLVKASDTEISITSKKDTLAMQNAVRQVVNSYNAILEAARGNESDRRTRLFMKNFERTAQFSKNQLKTIGIEITDKGYLTIDADKMKTAAESGAMEKFFKGTGSYATSNNFARRIESLVSEINKNPKQFISPSLRNLAVNTASLNNYDSQSTSQTNGYNYNDILSMLIDTLG